MQSSKCHSITNNAQLSKLDRLYKIPALDVFFRKLEVTVEPPESFGTHIKDLRTPLVSLIRLSSLELFKLYNFTVMKYV